MPTVYDPAVSEAVSEAAASENDDREVEPRRAVALGYNSESDKAPRLLASGTGTLAERLVALAFANGVKVRQDADLAELLVAVDVGEIIPLEAFAAVAEILSYLYWANAGKSEPTRADLLQKTPVFRTNDYNSDSDTTLSNAPSLCTQKLTIIEESILQNGPDLDSSDPEILVPGLKSYSKQV